MSGPPTQASGQGTSPPFTGSTTVPQTEKRQPIKVDKKIGRNEPCPCGSGKKYKKCHG